MSVMSILAFATGIAAKLRSPDAEITKLQAQVDALKRELKEARADLELVRHNREVWERIANGWRDHYEALARMPKNSLAQLQLGAHGQEWCNCVPARHDALIGAYRLNRSGGEA